MVRDQKEINTDSERTLLNWLRYWEPPTQIHPMRSFHIFILDSFLFQFFKFSDYIPSYLNVYILFQMNWGRDFLHVQINFCYAFKWKNPRCFRCLTSRAIADRYMFASHVSINWQQKNMHFKPLAVIKLLSFCCKFYKLVWWQDCQHSMMNKAPIFCLWQKLHYWLLYECNPGRAVIKEPLIILSSLAMIKEESINFLWFGEVLDFVFGSHLTKQFVTSTML